MNETTNPVILALEALYRAAGAADKMNPPAWDVAAFGLPEAELREIAVHFGLGVGTELVDGRAYIKAGGYVAGRRLNLKLYHDRESTPEELIAEHRRAIHALEARILERTNGARRAG